MLPAGPYRPRYILWFFVSGCRHRAAPARQIRHWLPFVWYGIPPLNLKNGLSRIWYKIRDSFLCYPLPVKRSADRSSRASGTRWVRPLWEPDGRYIPHRPCVCPQSPCICFIKAVFQIGNDTAKGLQSLPLSWYNQHFNKKSEAVQCLLCIRANKFKHW